MYLLDLVRLAGRRWVTFLAGLVLAAAAVVAAHSEVPVSHQATGQMLFILPPEATGAETPSNPYLNLDSGMTTTASLIAGMVSTDDVRDQLAAEGQDADYTVAPVPEAGPLLLFTATDTNAEDALSTRDALMDMVETRLAELQKEADVPARQLMRATRPTTSQHTAPIYGDTIKAMAAAGSAGVLLTFLLCLAVDRLKPFRRRRAALRAERARADEVAERVRAAKLATEALRVDEEAVGEVEVDADAEPEGDDAGREADEVADDDTAPDPVPELPAEEPLPATRRRRRRSAVRHQGRTADLHSEELDAPESLAG